AQRSASRRCDPIACPAPATPPPSRPPRSARRFRTARDGCRKRWPWRCGAIVPVLRFSIDASDPRSILGRQPFADFTGCLDLFRIALPEQRGGGRISAQQRADHGVQHGLPAIAKSFSHFLAGAPHPIDKRRVAKFRNAAAKIAGGKLVRAIVFAEEQSVFEW